MNKESSQSKVVATVRELLLAGELRQGEHITEESVAATMKVGRHTVRAAFAELETMGLLDREPHRGVRIPVLTPERINDLWDYRLALEVGAMRIAISRGHDLAILEDRTQALLALPVDASPARVASVHQRIHTSIIEMSGVERLREAYVRCEAELLWAVSTVGNVYDAQTLGTMHRDLLHACHVGGDAPVETLTEDIERGRAALLTSITHSTMTRAPFVAATGVQSITS